MKGESLADYWDYVGRIFDWGVEDGTTVSDFDPEEAKRHASLSASVVPVEYDGIKYNLIDAPGLFDFEEGEYEGVAAADSVLICVSARSGVSVGAEKAFEQMIPRHLAEPFRCIADADLHLGCRAAGLKGDPAVGDVVLDPLRLDRCHPIS